MAKLSDFELGTLSGLWHWADRATPQMAFEATTRHEAELWQAALRDQIIHLLGGFPTERCDLDPHVIESVEDTGFTRELVAIRTQPGEAMPCYILQPHNATPPYKAVIALHGHGSGGARLLIGNTDDPVEIRLIQELQYDYARELVQHGFLVFVPVLRGFAERMEAPPLRNTTDPAWHSSCHEAGMAALLCGKTLLGLRVWDIKRLIDYIQTRPEAMRPGLGCVGLSSGGTVTLFATALDPRITCAVVSGYLNTFRESIMAMRHCACNYVPGILTYAEMSDIAGLIAPRPLLVESGLKDPLFPARATRRALVKLKPVYERFDAAQNLDSVFFDGGHEWHGVKTYAWLEQRL